MSVFELLPLELWCDIFREWLEKSPIKEFVAVDLAMCNISWRMRFLQSMLSCHIQFHDKEFINRGFVVTNLNHCANWLHARGAILTSICFHYSIPKELEWSQQCFKTVTKLELCINEYSLDLEVMLNGLTQLRSLQIRGRSGRSEKLRFSISSVAKSCTQLVDVILDIDRIVMDRFELENFIVYLGSYAPALQSFHLATYSEDCAFFYLTLYHIHTITRFAYLDNGCVDTSRDKFIHLFQKDFPEMKEMTFPNIQIFTCLLNSDAVIPVYHKLTHLKELQYYGYPHISNEVADMILTHPNHPTITVFAGLFLLPNLMKLLLSSHTRPRKLCFSDPYKNEDIASVVRHCHTSLIYLNFLNIMNDLDMGIIASVTWPWLQTLHLRSAKATLAMYRTLLLSDCFPSLRDFSLDMTSAEDKHHRNASIDLVAVFTVLMTSPLHHQIETLRWTMKAYSSFAKTLEIADWSMIPSWTVLHTLHVKGCNVSFLPLQKFPHLYTLKIEDARVYCDMKTGRISSILSPMALQHIRRLKEFICVLPDPKMTLSMQCVYHLIAACPMLDTFVVCVYCQHSRLTTSYWDWNNSEHRELLQSYRYKIHFLQSTGLVHPF